jgi:uncharacterized protein (DUF779 family)
MNTHKDKGVKKIEDYQVRNPEIEGKLKGIGGIIGKTLPKGWGFTLLIFDYNTTKGSMFYISNGQRKDVIKAMIEFISKQGGDKS